jgi:hypothetical protein
VAHPKWAGGLSYHELAVLIGVQAGSRAYWSAVKSAVKRGLRRRGGPWIVAPAAASSVSPAGSGHHNPSGVSRT